MRILCPMCGFGRELDETTIPPRAQMATCPKCAHKFRFRVVDDLESSAHVAQPSAPLNAPPVAPYSPTGSFPSGQDLSATQPDPMARQRNAAAESWKRLQGTPAADAGKNPSDLTPPLDTSAYHVPESQDLDSAARSTGSPVPFEDLPRYGFFPGLWGTIRQVLTKPAAFFRTMPAVGGMGRPLAFHLLLAEFMILCQYVWGLAGVGASAQYLGSPDLMDMGLGMAEAAPVLLFIIYPLLLVLRLMIMTGVIHVLLRLLHSGQSGPEATFRVLCYAASPLLLGLAPGIGPLIGGIWSIGLTIIGLREVHKTSISAPMFAVLLPILLMLAVVLGLMQGMIKAG